MQVRRWLLSLPVFLVFFAVASLAQQPAYLDTHLSPAERAHDLVGRMTLEEKVNQLMVSWLQSLRSESKVSMPGTGESPGEGVQSR